MLKVEAPGFAAFSQKGITLQADESATVNVPLGLAQTGQEVTVDASQSQVNTTTSTLSEVVDTRRIVDLPLDGRNAASLALVTAGTLLAPNANGADQGNNKTFPGAVLVNSNGARSNQTNYRLDGASNTDIYTNVNQPFPNPDAPQEFSVQTSSYSAKYGGNAGGVDPNNQIPTSRFDPASIAFTKYLPIAPGGSGLTYCTLPTIQDFDEATARVDHAIGAKDHLSGRYFYDRFNNVGFLDLSNYTAQSADAIINAHNFMLLQGNGEFKDNRINTFGFYFQDDWHASRKLTLNLGMRYDPFYPWKETKGRIEIFSPSAYAAGTTSSVFTNAPPGLLFPGDPGVPQYGNKPNYKNFQPRFGFAYDVNGDAKTSIRGGFGMFYDSLQNGIYNNRFVDTSPFSVQVNLNPVNPNPPVSSYVTFSNPYQGITNPFPAPYPPPKNIAFPLPDLAASYDLGHGGTYQTPVTYQWNLSIERQLPGNWMVRGAYVGSHSSHGMENVELSPNVYPTGKHLYPQYSDIAMVMNDVNANYNSMQLTAQKRFSRGFTILANYTWAKAVDDWP